MECFAKRIMPERRWATWNFSKQAGVVELGASINISSKHKKYRPHREAWSSYMFNRLLKMPPVLKMPGFWIWYSCISNGYAELWICLIMAPCGSKPEYATICRNAPQYTWAWLNIAECPWICLEMPDCIIIVTNVWLLDFYIQVVCYHFISLTRVRT